ncbi:hypothetical protein BU24DRAFT_158448 [Aaosphaeria arxii CBS 175.79]|uniref:Uncharacterized protein n=1 Tax=Aaosphaeria arxii CBS 175.79 TaxID=1450172 RepID=A0A6A5XY58_9PLEO|nr:uncharacterized protein BU24DRAFT_158448 [Aaosphaeria arxii CBS 175.79]KAF2017767.1 hypothetical protein BU24DRAFT_158448 [Aaosphaeria arxii CBS 175.79]
MKRFYSGANSAYKYTHIFLSLPRHISRHLRAALRMSGLFFSHAPCCFFVYSFGSNIPRRRIVFLGGGGGTNWIHTTQTTHISLSFFFWFCAFVADG